MAEEGNLISSKISWESFEALFVPKKTYLNEKQAN